MKKSIKHLPERTQEELNLLVELILEKVKNCQMIILFGSYARGEHVFWDERHDFGTHTTFQSDLDIMVVVDKGNLRMAEAMLRDKVKSKYKGIFKELRPSSPGSKVIHYATPQFVVEHGDVLNKELEESQYFFTDIVKDGIMLYDAKELKLAKPRNLLFKEIKEIAVKEYDVKFKFGNEFLHHSKDDLNYGYYVTGSFQLHQACERYFNAIDLVFTNYKAKTHDLEELLGKTKKYSRDLVTVFPLNTEFEWRCYDLLCKAYIEARYNPDFVVTKQEYEYILERVGVLKEITERICTEKIKSYDLLIAEQEACIEDCPEEPPKVHDTCVDDCIPEHE